MQRPRGGVISLVVWGTAKGHGMANVVRDEAEEGGTERATRSSTVSEMGLSVGVPRGATDSFKEEEGHSTLSLWVGSPDHISATRFRLKHLQGPSAPFQAVVENPDSPASHQACIVPVHTLRLLHHAGEAAGTGRGAGEVLQHFCSLGCCLHSATDSVPSASTHSGPPLGPDPRPLPSRPASHLCACFVAP